MKAFRSKISNAAGRLKDTVERSVLSDDVGGGGGGGGPRSRRNSRSEGSGEALDEDNTFVRLPLEAARKIRCFSKGDVGEIIARHLKEKEELLGEILSLRDLCMKCAPHMEVKKLVDQSKAEKICEVTKVTNSLILISAKSEIESLRKQVQEGGGQGNGGHGAAGHDKVVAALEWKLEEAESEVLVLREEISDLQDENAAAQKELRELKREHKAASATMAAKAKSPPSSSIKGLKKKSPLKKQQQQQAMESRASPTQLPVDLDFFGAENNGGGGDNAGDGWGDAGDGWGDNGDGWGNEDDHGMAATATASEDTEAATSALQERVSEVRLHLSKPRTRTVSTPFAPSFLPLSPSLSLFSLFLGRQGPVILWRGRGSLGSNSLLFFDLLRMFR